MNNKLILVGLAFLLSGCSPAMKTLQFQMALKGETPLSSQQVKSLYTDATAYHKATNYEFSGYYGVNGHKAGKSWGQWGEESDDGSWHVTKEGHLCGEWSGSWAKGPRCVSIYPGESKDEYIETVVLGPRFRSNPSGVYYVRIVPGDVADTDQALLADSTQSE